LGTKKKTEGLGQKSPSGVPGVALVEGLETKSPGRLSFLVKLNTIFSLKYNKQQLLLLLDKINLKYWGTLP